MKPLDLNEKEQHMLREELKSQLSDLRMQISGTDRKAVRDLLKKRKRVFEKVIEALSDAKPTP